MNLLQSHYSNPENYDTKCPVYDDDVENDINDSFF